MCVRLFLSSEHNTCLHCVIYISKTVCVRLFLSGEHNTLEGSIGMAESAMWNVCNLKHVMPAKWAKQLVWN